MKKKTIAELALLCVLLYVGWWFYTTHFTAHQAPTTSTISNVAGQHPVTGGPALSASQVDAILAAHDSPATGTGQTFYDLSIQMGINDAYALAFFNHESSYGLAGVARFSHSIGNLRCIATAACVGGYAYFASWQDGITAWYALIRNLYINTWKLVTVEQIIPKYAPPDDRNDDAAYIRSVVSTVQAWQEGIRQ
jgi:hypothetical protein